MSDRPFFDTNVLIYSTLAHDPRAAPASALLAGGGVVSVQVLNEFAATSIRKLKRSWPEVRSALGAFRTLCPDVRAITIATHQAALRIAQQGGFGFYDALIVASALEAGCVTLLSEDMQHERIVSGRLTIRNPFVAATRRMPYEEK